MTDKLALLEAVFEEYQSRNLEEKNRKVGLTEFHKEIIRKDENKTLSKFDYRTLTRCFYDEWPEYYRELFKIIDIIIAGWGLSNDDVILNAFNDVTQHGRFGKLPEILTGGWLVVQFRSNRASAADILPPKQIRTGVLIYGRSIDEKKRYIEVGISTLWSGEVYLKREFLFYKAFEKGRMGQFEKMNFIMKDIRPVSEVIRHHGMRFGTGFDDHGGPLLYSSRLSLIKIPEWSEWAAPLKREKVEEVRRYCQYIPYDQEIPDGSFGEVTQRVRQAVEDFKIRGANPHNTDLPSFVVV